MNNRELLIQMILELRSNGIKNHNVLKAVEKCPPHYYMSFFKTNKKNFFFINELVGITKILELALSNKKKLENILLVGFDKGWLLYLFSFFAKRFSSLFLFGILHILFIWSGDILHLYALIGFGICILYKGSAKVLLWASIIIFMFPYYQEIADKIFAFFEFDNMAYLNKIPRETLIELKREGNYLSGVQLRMKEYLFAIGLIFSRLFPFAAGMAILGAYLVKKGAFNNLYNFIYQIRIPFLLATIGLISYRFAFLYGIRPNYHLDPGSIFSIVLINFFILADMAIALLYVWILIFLFQKQSLKKLLSIFSYAGKMAFTNYVLQSIIGYILMRSLGLYELLTPSMAIVIVLFVFIGQILFSKLWLSVFKLGPLEWLWRCISYGKVIPIKIKANNKHISA